MFDFDEFRRVLNAAHHSGHHHDPKLQTDGETMILTIGVGSRLSDENREKLKDDTDKIFQRKDGDDDPWIPNHSLTWDARFSVGRTGRVSFIRQLHLRSSHKHTNSCGCKECCKQRDPDWRHGGRYQYNKATGQDEWVNYEEAAGPFAEPDIERQLDVGGHFDVHKGFHKALRPIRIKV